LLLTTIRHGNRDTQPGQYANDDLDWAKPEQRLTEIGQRLAKKLTQELAIDPVEGCKLAKSLKEKAFPRAIVIKPKKAIEKDAKTIYRLDRNNSDLVIWSDGSKFNSEEVETGIALKQRET